MANFDIPDNPEFSSELRKFETTDPAHADLFNEVTEKLFTNELALKKMCEKPPLNYTTNEDIDNIVCGNYNEESDTSTDTGSGGTVIIPDGDIDPVTEEEMSDLVGGFFDS